MSTPRPVREITTSATEEPAWPEFEIKLDGVTLKAQRPKRALVMRAQAALADRFTPDDVVVRTAFEFLEATFDTRSWQHVRERILNREDTFDEEGLADLFNGVMEELSEQAKELELEEAPNREAKRDVARRQRAGAAARG